MELDDFSKITGIINGIFRMYINPDSLPLIKIVDYICSFVHSHIHFPV
jgi:hypothetical protein